MAICFFDRGAELPDRALTSTSRSSDTPVTTPFQLPRNLHEARLLSYAPLSRLFTPTSYLMWFL